MTILPPAGWYPDPHGGSTPRWWDGRAWAPQAAAPQQPVQTTAGVSGFHPTARTFVVLGVVGFIALVSASTGGAGAFLTVVGLGAVIVAIVALVRGGIRSFALRSRTAGAIALASGLVVLMVGGGVSAATSPPTPSQQANSFADTEQSTEEAPASEESPTSSPTKPTTVVVVTTVEVEETIPYASVTVDDPNLAAGSTVTSTTGVPGVLVVSYRVTTTDGVETGRQRVSEQVAVAAIDQVTSRGTYVAPPPAAPASSGCDPNYSGCVPIASDVDCAGGSGNGPAYLSGTVTVVGTDIYDLDRDGDGTACE